MQAYTDRGLLVARHLLEGFVLALLISIGFLSLESVMPSRFEPMVGAIIFSLPTSSAVSILAYGSISSRSLVALHTSLLICLLIFFAPTGVLVDTIWRVIGTPQWDIEIWDALKIFVLEVTGFALHWIKAYFPRGDRIREAFVFFALLIYVPALVSLFLLSLIRSFFRNSQPIAAQWSPYKTHIILLSIIVLMFASLSMKAINQG